MDELVIKARQQQPGLIVVDRAVYGKNQNYLTPENRVPEMELSYPWESCIIAGGSWSWVPDASYFSTREAVHLLVDIVAKGGNLLLNIAPGPDGSWHDGAYTMLSGVGDWMTVNSQAIYETRAIAPYKTDNICLTQNVVDGVVYAIYLADEGEFGLPVNVRVNGVLPAETASVSLLGTERELEWQVDDTGFTVVIPAGISEALPCDDAWTLRISEVQ